MKIFKLLNNVLFLICILYSAKSKSQEIWQDFIINQSIVIQLPGIPVKLVKEENEVSTNYQLRSADSTCIYGIYFAPCIFFDIDTSKIDSIILENDFWELLKEDIFFDDYNLVSEKKIVILGKEAREFEFVYTKETETGSKITYVVFIYDKTVYAFGYRNRRNLSNKSNQDKFFSSIRKI